MGFQNGHLTSGDSYNVWSTGTAYALNNVVIFNFNLYVCDFAHTSSTFASDLAAGYWVISSAVENVTSKTANYTASTTDSVILADSTSGLITITLPTAVGNLGKTFKIKKTNSAINSVIVATSSSQLIDDVLTFSLFIKNEELEVISDGANWKILNKILGSYYARASTATGQSISSGSVTTINYDSVEIDDAACVTTGASWAYTVKAPGLYQIKFSYAFAASTFTAGVAHAMIPALGGVSKYLYFTQQSTTTTILAPGLLSFSGRCSAGETIYGNAVQSSGANKALLTDGNYNWITIERIGD